MQGNSNNKRREETDANKHDNIQVSDRQEHTINVLPNKEELTKRSEHTVSDQQIDKNVNITT